MAGSPQLTPDKNDTGNSTVNQAVGNKEDAPLLGPTASLHAKIEKVGAMVGSTAFKLDSESDCPDIAQPGETIVFSITLKNRDTGLAIPVGDITPGTLDVYRVKSGVQTKQISGASLVKGDGQLFYTLALSGPIWSDSDSYLFFPLNDSSVDIGGTSYDVVVEPRSGIISDLGGIASDVTAIKAGVQQTNDDDAKPIYVGMAGRLLEPHGRRGVHKWVHPTSLVAGSGDSRSNAWTIAQLIANVNTLPPWSLVTFICPDQETYSDLGTGGGGGVSGLICDNLASVMFELEPNASIASWQSSTLGMDMANKLYLGNKDLNSNVITMRNNCKHLVFRGLQLIGTQGVGFKSKYGIKDDSALPANSLDAFITGCYLTGFSTGAGIHVRKSDNLRVERTMFLGNLMDVDVDYANTILTLIECGFFAGLGGNCINIANASMLLMRDPTFIKQSVSATYLTLGNITIAEWFGGKIGDAQNPVVLSPGPAEFNMVGVETGKDEESLIMLPDSTMVFNPVRFGNTHGKLDLLLDMSPIIAGDSITMDLEMPLEGVVGDKRYLHRDFVGPVSANEQIWHVFGIPATITNRPKLIYTKIGGGNRTLKGHWMIGK